jgi:hypothetical protein
VSRRVVSKRIARFAAGAALSCLPFSAYALDLTPDSSRILSDPNYLPLTGQIYGYTNYSHAWTSGSSFNDLGSQTSSFHINTNTMTQFLSYGVTDDLEVFGQADYVPDSYREVDNVNGTQSFFKSAGFSDPTFGVDWRAMDAGPFPFNVDLIGSYTPDAVDSENASTTSTGSVARGGQSGSIGAALGYQTRDFTARGSFSADFNGGSNTLNLANGEFAHTQGYNNYVLGLETQTRLNPLFSVNAGINHTFAGNQNALNTATDLAHLTEPGDTTALHAQLNYNLIPDQVVLAGTYTHQFYGNSRTSYADASLDNSSRDRDGNVLGVQLYYAFP